MSGPFIVMINPKTFDLVQMHADGHAGRFRMAFFGVPDACIANAYLGDETVEIDGDTYKRIHSAGDCERRRADEFSGVNDAHKGQGFGLLLYAGTAVGVHLLRRHLSGVFSPTDGGSSGRSRDASKLWNSLVKHDVAEEATAETTDEREEEERHCASFSEDEKHTDDGGYISDDEVCGRVTVVYSGTDTEVQYINGEKTIEQDWVLWAKGETNEYDPMPGDIIVRAKVQNKDAAVAIIKFIKKHYDSDEADQLVAAFTSRTDIIEFFGQERLPGLTGPSRRGTPLPPLSARSKKMIARFRNAP